MTTPIRRRSPLSALLGLAGLAVVALVPVARAVDDPPPPECPLCGGDPALHAKRINDLTILRFEIFFDGVVTRS